MRCQVGSPWLVVNSGSTSHSERLLTTGYPIRAPRAFPGRGFTLLEVMIACGIFFIAVFAILALVSNTLRNARSLRHVEVEAGMGAAYSMRTNLLYEGSETVELDAYPEYRWELIYTPVESNGLWQVDIALFRRGANQPVETMSILRFSPESKVE